MKYEFVAIPDEEVAKAANPLFQHVVTTYASETNKAHPTQECANARSHTYRDARRV